MLLEENLKKVLCLLEKKNPFGEKVELVGAIKTIDTDTINLSIEKGVKIVAENKVQEFLEKNDKIVGAKRHFIGHLQTNKVKYIVGKVDLIHSVDSLHLATAISDFALKNKITQNILVEINIGKENTKSGLAPENALKEIEEIKKLPSIKVKGLMCMLPPDIDLAKQKELCYNMRSLFDSLKSVDSDIEYLSMGMSGDYQVAIECGSNMIRLGSFIYGKRDYKKEKENGNI